MDELDQTPDALDLDGDGYDETLAYDDNADGEYDYVEIDADADGYHETAILDADFDGAADVVLVDVDADGIVDQAFDAQTGEELILDEGTDPVDPASQTELPIPSDPTVPGPTVPAPTDDIVLDEIPDEVDSDGNGIVDTYEYDDNGDGVADYVEIDVDEDGQIDAAIVDDDFDGIFDTAISDTDGDGEPEVYDIETGEPVGGETEGNDDLVVSEFPEGSPFQL
jgi:hypothetical protein